MERFIGKEMVDDSHDPMSTDDSSWSTKRRDKVWDYVDSKVLDGRDKVICKYCKLHLYSIPRRCNSHLNRRIGFHCQNIIQKDIDRFLAILKSPTENKLYLTLLSSEV